MTKMTTTLAAARGVAAIRLVPVISRATIVCCSPVSGRVDLRHVEIWLGNVEAVNNMFVRQIWSGAFWGRYKVQNVVFLADRRNPCV